MFGEHFPNPLDVRIHQVLSQIIEQIEQISTDDFLAIFSDLRGRDLILYSEMSDFHNLKGLGDFDALNHFVCHNIHNIRCLEPFLPLYDHFEIRRFLGINWQY